MVSRRRIIARVTTTGAILGAAVAAVVMYMAWQHNPQGEFHEGGAIHAAWFELGFMYFAFFVLLGASTGIALAFLGRRSTD